MITLSVELINFRNDFTNIGIPFVEISITQSDVTCNSISDICTQSLFLVRTCDFYATNYIVGSRARVRYCCVLFYSFHHRDIQSSLMQVVRQQIARYLLWYIFAQKVENLALDACCINALGESAFFSYSFIVYCRFPNLSVVSTCPSHFCDDCTRYAANHSIYNASISIIVLYLLLQPLIKVTSSSLKSLKWISLLF